MRALLAHINFARDGCRNQGGSVLFYLLNACPNCGNQGINFGGFVIEVGSNGLLFRQWRDQERNVPISAILK
jgi:hypothetical protein